MNLEEKNYMLYLTTISLSDPVFYVELILDAGEENNWKYKIYFLKKASFFCLFDRLNTVPIYNSIFTFPTPFYSNFIKYIYSLPPFYSHLGSEKTECLNFIF